MDKKLGLWDYINSVDSSDIPVYFIFSIVAGYSFYNGIENHTAVFLVALIIGISIVLSNDKKISLSNDINRELETKLFLIDKNVPPNLYLDPDLVNFLFSIKDFKKYNPDTYTSIIKTTDNLLRLRKDFEQDLINPVETFRVAEMNYEKAVNYLHSFIISLPKEPTMKNKYQKSLERFQLLLKRNMDYMFKRCMELTKNIDNTTQFITDYNIQKPYNPRSAKFGSLSFNVF